MGRRCCSGSQCLGKFEEEKEKNPLMKVYGHAREKRQVKQKLELLSNANSDEVLG